MVYLQLVSGLPVFLGQSSTYGVWGERWGMAWEEPGPEAQLPRSLLTHSPPLPQTVVPSAQITSPSTLKELELPTYQILNELSPGKTSLTQRTGLR